MVDGLLRSSLEREKSMMKEVKNSLQLDQEVNILNNLLLDNSIMIWDITPKKQTDGDDEEWGIPRRVLKGKLIRFLIL